MWPNCLVVESWKEALLSCTLTSWKLNCVCQFGKFGQTGKILIWQKISHSYHASLFAKLMIIAFALLEWFPGQKIAQL